MSLKTCVPAIFSLTFEKYILFTIYAILQFDWFAKKIVVLCGFLLPLKKVDAQHYLIF